MFHVFVGCAIACAVDHWLPTTATQVWSQGRLCGIYGEQNGTGAGFLLSNFHFPLQFSSHQMFQYLSTFYELR
jgi:hypothetical protein